MAILTIKKSSIFLNMSKDTSKNINKKGEKEGTERNERDVFYLVPPNVDEEETAL